MGDIYDRYREFCRLAAADPAVFASFRRHPDYTRILEHVTFEQGVVYLHSLNGTFYREAWTYNDSVGSPVLYAFPGVGRFSPTTLRYAKCVNDLEKLFGDLSGSRVVEIGGGYGGLSRLVQDKWRCDYTIVDLPEALGVARCYLGSLGTQASFVEPQQFVEPADLVISNYALSELDEAYIRSYVERVVLTSRLGYITVNGAGDLLTDLLSARLPVRLEEIPLTGPGNFLLVWGTNAD